MNGIESGESTQSNSDLIVAQLKDRGVRGLEIPSHELAAALSAAFHPDIESLGADFAKQDYIEQTRRIANMFVSAAPHEEAMLSVLASPSVNKGVDKGLLNALKIPEKEQHKYNYHHIRAQLVLQEARAMAVLNAQDERLDALMSQGVRTQEIAQTIRVIQKALKLHETRKGESIISAGDLIQTAAHGEIKQVTEFYPKSHYAGRRNSALVTTALGVTVAALVSSCGVGFGTQEIPINATSTPKTETATATATATRVESAGQRFTAAAALKTLAPWEHFTIQGHPFEITGDVTLPLEVNDPTNTRVLVARPSVDGRILSDDAWYTTARANFLVDGKTYPGAFLIRFDAKTGEHAAYLLDNRRSEDGKTLYDIGILDDQDEARLAPLLLVIDGDGFYLLEADATPPTPAGPTASGDNVSWKTIDVVFQTPPLSFEPTPPVDPNTPEGATGKDSQGYYKDVIDGNKTERYRDIVLYNSSGEIVYRGWLSLRTAPEGFPTLDYPNDTGMEGYERDLAHIRVLVSAQADGALRLASLVHNDKTMDQVNDLDLTSEVVVEIFKRMNGRNPQESELWDFDKAIQNSELPINFTTADGQSHAWHVSPDHGSVVIVSDWDSMDPSDGSGVSEFDDPYDTTGKTKVRARALGLDEEGNIVGEIAVNVPLDTLTDEQLWELILFHMANVINHEDQGEQYFNNTLSSFIAAMINQDGIPWVDRVSP